MPLHNSHVPAATGGVQRKTVPTGTATALTAAACRSVTIKAMSTNTVTVYIGFTAATTTVAGGFALDPGDTVSVEVDNCSDIFSISGTASQTLTVIYTI